MANDRLYIKCDECGELFFVGKHFGGAWDVRNYYDCSFQFSLDDFLAKHYLTCNNNRSDYSFIAEFDDDFPEHPKYYRYGGK